MTGDIHLYETVTAQSDEKNHSHHGLYPFYVKCPPNAYG